MIDPIAALLERRREESGANPALLCALDIEVTIRGGLALVETTRTYVNQEERPVEALLSIPVPVHAAFFGLTAKIGGKLYEATAAPREEARENYEDAIDEGRGAVLHEEVLRGVHSLSVANLAPGAEAEVRIRWAESLRFLDASARLRIPLTVGDVYGISGLPDTDELVHGGDVPQATLRVRHDASDVRLADGTLAPSPDGSLVTEIPANAPVDIEVTGWTRIPLAGRAADGREVAVAIEPASGGSGTIDAVLLVDHSGSMYSRCEGGLQANLTKHDAVRSALDELAGTLRDDDRIALWEFDTSCEPVGSGQPVGPSEFGLLVPDLSEPAGGTKIGGALDRVRSVEARDVLLITDGKSYALDVQRQALVGRRIFVVLVGEDSLEARVGHLAALTGGDLQFSFGADVGRALAACVQGMRLRRVENSAGEFDADGSPLRVRTARGGASIEARWTARSTDGEAEPFSAAVAAYAASLAVACASKDHATGIAVREGLVTHLTSLFLRVDDGERQEGLPLTRRVGLPTPRTALRHGVSYSPAADSGPPQSPERIGAEPLMPAMPAPEVFSPRPVPDRVDIAAIAGVIDWDIAADALARGDLRRLPGAVADVMLALSVHEDVRAAAAGLGIDGLLLAIALVAEAAADRSRQAARVRRRILQGVSVAEFEAFARDFGGDEGLRA
ncbi:MAG: VWA domain-containing protein [Chloroflexi bacterium]|nr:VWA domain-containing protein [Chloroflexota bacterium]